MSATKPTKFYSLMQEIKAQIESGELSPGDKLPTESELCRTHGISRQTVRQALTLLQKDEYVESRQGSGSYVSDNVKTRKIHSMTVGVISTYLDDYIFPRLIRGIQKELTGSGYTMQLGITSNNVHEEELALKAIMDKCPSGILIEPAKSALPRADAAIFEQIKAKRIPCIFMNSFMHGLDFPLVSLDDRRSGYIAADYLIKSGHTAIGGCFKVDDQPGHMRYNGFSTALKEAGIPEKDRNVLWYTTSDIDLLFSGNADKYILSSFAGCTAVVCYNDLIAIKLMDVFSRNGIRVPEDISIVGHDNSNTSALVTPALTTVNHPIEQLGQLAAENLIKYIKDGEYDPSLLIEPTLVIRDSVKTIE